MESFAVARFRARLTPHRPPTVTPPREWTPEERADLLLRTVTMSEIKGVAAILRISFNEAYRERARLFEERWFS